MSDWAIACLMVLTDEVIHSLQNDIPSIQSFNHGHGFIFQNSVMDFNFEVFLIHIFV